MLFLRQHEKETTSLSQNPAWKDGIQQIIYRRDVGNKTLQNKGKRVEMGLEPV